MHSPPRKQCPTYTKLDSDAIVDWECLNADSKVAMEANMESSPSFASEDLLSSLMKVNSMGNLNMNRVGSESEVSGGFMFLKEILDAPALLS